MRTEETLARVIQKEEMTQPVAVAVQPLHQMPIAAAKPPLKEKNASFKRRKAARARKNTDPPLPKIELVPKDQVNGNFKPFVLLMIGIPGSGKSAFADCLVKGKPWKYVSVNQDTLGNRRACEEMCRKVLEDGQCPVIDRCNFDQKQRQHWFNIAAENNVLVDGVVFSIPKTKCLRRCQNRPDHPTLPPSEAAGIVTQMERQFKPPVTARKNKQQKEKFRKLHSVTNAATFCNVVMEFLNKK